VIPDREVPQWQPKPARASSYIWSSELFKADAIDKKQLCLSG